MTDEEKTCPNCDDRKTLYYAGMVVIGVAVILYVAFLWQYTDKAASVEEYEKLQSTCQALVRFCGEEAVMPWGEASGFDYNQFGNKSKNGSIEGLK